MHLEEYGHVVELMLLKEVRQVRYCYVCEADLVKDEVVPEVEHYAEVKATNVSESAGTRQGIDRWLERQTQHAQRVSVDFYADSAATVEVVGRFVVDLTACSRESVGGLGQVAAESVSSRQSPQRRRERAYL